VNILLTNATGIFAGGEDYVLILAKYLQKRGHAVWVSANPGHLLLTKCSDERINTLPVAYTGMGRVFEVAGELRRHLRSLAIDVVHSNANYDRTVAAMAAAWTGTRHVASVHSAHSIQHNITHWLRNKFGTDHFIADAEAVKSVLMQQDGVAESSITVVPIGVEAQPDDKSAGWRKSTRARWNTAADTCVIGNVARLVPFKGHRHLVTAMAQVVRSHPNVVCVIVGDGELMPELTAQTRSLGIENGVRFLGFQDNLHELYPAFDVYCHTSLELEAEAFPLAILRALATGLPVVATKVGGIGLMVEEGKSGYLTQAEQPDAIAQALIRLLTDKQLRNTMGTASRKLFDANFRAEVMAERVERVYLRTMGSRKK
jgi:glycosyltransferase involved in cell wall biosynthesis